MHPVIKPAFKEQGDIGNNDGGARDEGGKDLTQDLASDVGVGKLVELRAAFRVIEDDRADAFAV